MHTRVWSWHGGFASRGSYRRTASSRSSIPLSRHPTPPRRAGRFTRDSHFLEKLTSSIVPCRPRSPGLSVGITQATWVDDTEHTPGRNATLLHDVARTGGPFLAMILTRRLSRVPRQNDKAFSRVLAVPVSYRPNRRRRSSGLRPGILLF